ncbi:hypothetical protein JAAARDRAFT_197109 [Jaapia argillacea MUCL 33604]|uniref:Uncharacterized protein n=1 Tax=Jaapia argillacea MUCL 33604 TaxID=933084 RepID=A0A067PGV7_9AGAM|nr:hypothetical protein JAAARDRAFT_197109 [Jaapia argillacea MUCL 33604]
MPTPLSCTLTFALTLTNAYAIITLAWTLTLINVHIHVGSELTPEISPHKLHALTHIFTLTFALANTNAGIALTHTLALAIITHPFRDSPIVNICIPEVRSIKARVGWLLGEGKHHFAFGLPPD